MLLQLENKLTVTKSYAAVEVYINKESQEENKKIFDHLFSNKDAIENVYGGHLTWERLDDKKSSRITDRMFNVDITNREDWDKIKDFLCRAMVKFEKAIKEPLKKAVASKKIHAC